MSNEIDAREERRKKRKKTQIITYMVTILFLLSLTIGIIFGVKVMLKKINLSKAQTEANKLAEQLKEEPVIVPTIEPEEELIEEPDVLGELTDSIIMNMTLEEKVASLFIVTPEALTGYNQVLKAGNSTKEALEQYSVGGIVYFSKNIQTEEQVKEMLANTIQYSKYVPFIAIDEEGGAVSRVANSSLTTEKYENMDILGKTMTSEEAVSMGQTIGAYLSAYGFNMNFAPVADILINPNSPMENRIFSSDKTIVADLSSSVVKGMQEQKISACMKHFPGLGSVEEDSHNMLPSTARTLEEMRQEEFLPFIAGIEIGVDMIMVGHLSTPEITSSTVPASMSKMMITEILREELKFEGIIITDSMQMVAITKEYTSAQAAVGAIEAGADMVLMPKDFKEAYQGVLDAIAAGILTEERINESLHRIFCVKYKYTQLAN